MLSLIQNLVVREEWSFKFYHYDPNMPCAVLFAVAFVMTTLWHAWQIYRSRCRFMIPMLIGGIFEVVGYCGRAVSSTETPDWTIGPYVIQNTLLLLAPALFAASIYIELGRMITMMQAESFSMVSPKRMTKFFVTGDVLSFLIQAAGGQLMAMGGSDGIRLGPKVVIGGLFCQLAFFAFFMAVAARFHLMVRSDETYTKLRRTHMTALFVASTLIMIRSVVRVIEYVQGFDGYVLSKEAFLYVFDAALMLAVMVLFNVLHPGQVLGGDEAKSMEGSESEELKV